MGCPGGRSKHVRLGPAVTISQVSRWGRGAVGRWGRGVMRQSRRGAVVVLGYPWGYPCRDISRF